MANTKQPPDNPQSKVLLLCGDVESATDCKRKPDTKGYLEWHTMAEEYSLKGIFQTQCVLCKKWIWPSEL
jgi:hypothetical protein